MIRFFDILFSIVGLILLIPLFIIICIIILLTSSGGIFYFQKRVGRFGNEFWLIKFRTMSTGSDKNGLLTVGENDSRITKVGKFLRKYKIDELPQLLNVIFGSMSIVGPRPEVKKYVNLYDDNQKRVLTVRPGITDYASIYYSNESELLVVSDNPEQLYIDTIMPDKIRLNMKFIDNPSLGNYFRVIFLTIYKIIR